MKILQLGPEPLISNIFISFVSKKNRRMVATMEPLIPISPLEVMVYPDDALNLHIFEPRYQQLINDAVKSKKPFGIPAVVGRKICGLGTLVKLISVANVQADGQMDIKTRGLRIFQIGWLQKLFPGKLSSAALVEYPPNDETGDATTLR